MDGIADAVNIGRDTHLTKYIISGTPPGMEMQEQIQKSAVKHQTSQEICQFPTKNLCNLICLVY